MLAYLHDKHVYEAKFDRVMGEFGWHTCWSYCMTKVKPSLTFLGGAYMSTYMLVRVTVRHTVKHQLNFTCCEGRCPLTAVRSALMQNSMRGTLYYNL